MKSRRLKKEGKIIAIALLSMFIGLGLSFLGAEKLGYFIGATSILVVNIFGIIAIIKATAIMKNKPSHKPHNDVNNEYYKK